MATAKTPVLKSKQTYIQSVGRRREATARVRLYPLSGKSEVIIDGKSIKKGMIVVNDLPVETYFPGSLNEKIYTAPLKVAGVEDVAIAIHVAGGGKNGQLGATVHALARAIDELNPESNHSPLKKRGFLTRDPRKRERRKAGLAGRARAKKSSPKR